ncbi:CHAT domain-containing protein [Larkinella soli]|uniref:CHAT domain-containing protein n=1 Tax=Larkinella soli TaxID=1770527 RepID=UPI000FFC100C|nr:CHAT domain-containing protein [Larkinella soli]
MNTLLFCFANDRDRPLASLKEEDEGIEQLLDPRSSKNHFLKVRESFATTDSVANKLLTYRDSLCVFHFSGHAGGRILQFEDTTARGVGVAQLLAQCPNLKLVFLNGCSTLDHLKSLTAHGVKAAVIATCTPIEDRVAAQFSQDFYRALANQHTLREALDNARMKLQLTLPTQIGVVERGALVDSLEEVSRNQWYFFCPDPELARWELPTGEESAAVDYKPNAALRTALFQSLRAFDPGLTEAFKTKQGLPPEALKSWLNEELLRRLPYPLSEPLRKLLCPQLSPEGKLLPVTTSRERLLYYVALFDSTVDLLVGTLLAQIRENLQSTGDRNGVLPLHEDLNQVIQSLLTGGWSTLAPQPLVTMLKAMGRFLVENRVELFIREMEGLSRQFSEQVTFFESILFFHDLRGRLSSSSGPGSIPSLCQIGEDHLAELLKQLGFWANYRLESVKNIRTVRFFNRKPEFAHEKVVLRTSQSYRLDEWYFQEVKLSDMWDSQSVLLVKTERRTGPEGRPDEPVAVGFLNLSPLIVDRNAFLRSDNSVFDLYSFHSLEENRLQFRHIARPEDPLLRIGLDEADYGHQQDYTVLRDQYRTVLSLFSAPWPGEAVSAAAQSDDIDLSLLSLPD